MRVRAGSIYIFTRNGIDRFDPNKLHPSDGTKVRVVNKYGCPKANTMGHCYIESMDGNFLGLCSTSSLEKGE